MAAETLTSGAYIKHHLQNLTFGQLPDGHWGFAQDAAQAKAMGFWSVHVDTLFFSLVTGLVFLYFFNKAARRATADIPDGLQNFAEWVVEFVDQNVRGSFSGKNDLQDAVRLLPQRSRRDGRDEQYCGHRSAVHELPQRDVHRPGHRQKRGARGHAHGSAIQLRDVSDQLSGVPQPSSQCQGRGQ